MKTDRSQTYLVGILSACLALFAVNQADAGLIAVGGEFQVNTYTTGDQDLAAAQSVARAPDGSFVAVWYSVGTQDGSGSGVFGRRFASNGTPNGGEFQINTYTTGYQATPTAATFADGGFVVVWRGTGRDGSDTSVHGRRFDSSGAVAGAEFRVNSYTTGGQAWPSVDAHADGSFVVVWQGPAADEDTTGIRGQRFSSNGVGNGGEFRVNSYTTGGQAIPGVETLANGGFVAVWQSPGQDTSGDGMFGQRFDSLGAPAGGEFRVNASTYHHQRGTSAATASDSSMVVVWADGAGLDGASYSVQAQRYDSGGAAIGGQFLVNSYTTGVQFSTKVAGDPDGSFVVAWTSSANQDGSSFGIFAQRFRADGTADGPEFPVNSYTSGSQIGPTIASDGFGNYVVLWSSSGPDGSAKGVFGQLLCSDRNGDDACDLATTTTTSTTSTSTTSTSTTTSTTSTTLPPSAACPSAPAEACSDVVGAMLSYNEKKPGKEKLKMQWKKIADATAQNDFGDPVGGNTSVALCIYDDGGALVEDFLVDRAGDQCAGKPCWKTTGTKGYAYKDKDVASDGIAGAKFKSGKATKGKADASGKNNPKKGQTTLPTGVVAALSGKTAPTIQMLTSDGFCVGATMTQVKKDDGTRYRALKK